MDIDLTFIIIIIVKIAVAVILACIFATIVYGMFRVIFSENRRWNLARALHVPQGLMNLLRSDDSTSNAQRKVYEEVAPDHQTVSSWVLNCTDIKDVTAIPSSMIDLFNLGGSLSFSLVTDFPSGSRAPNRIERSILQLSKTIGVRRLQLADRAARSYRMWQLTTMITIGLGMLTTIVVSLSTTDFASVNSRVAAVIKIFAIILPALSTAMAAAFAFYGHQSTWAQATRTSTSLAQLHGQMAIDVWSLDPAVDDPSMKKAAAVLDGWSKRYLDIQTISAAATQGSPTQGSGGQPSGSGQGANPPAGRPVGADAQTG